MRPIERSELLELGAYEQIRDRFRARVIAEKKRRRLEIGDHISVLFENRDTVLHQIQEMLRTERITQESAIQHELETYNQLIPGEGELSATFFIEYTDASERDRMLVELAGIEQAMWFEAGGERAQIQGEKRGDRTDRTTALHYTRIPLGERALAALREARGPAKIGVTHPSYSAEVLLPEATLEALRADLS
jgi:hypothetical protein